MQLDLASIFKKALKDEATILRPYYFPSDTVDEIPLANEETYLRLRLARMFLKDRRVLFQTKYPVVNTAMRFSGPDGTAESQFVVRPELAGEGKQADLDRVVALDQTVLGPILYRGGDMELLLGLYAAPADDWAKRFLKLAESMSQLTLNVPLSTAIGMASTIKQSLEETLGRDGLDLKLGIDMELKENVTLKPGYLVLIAAPDAEVDQSALRVENGELLTAGGQVYADHDYVVVAIETSRRRSDWQTLGYAKAWKKLLDVAANANDIESVKTAYLTFNGIIQSSEDLSLSDRNAIVALAQERVKAIREARANTDFLDGLKDISALDEVARLVSEELTLPDEVDSSLDATELSGTAWLDS